MTWRGRVERYLRSIVEEGEVVHMTLVDPEKFSDDIYKAVAQMIEAGTDAILVGGSLMVMERDVDAVVNALKDFGKPVILFPGSVAGISREADAILFLSVLNSDDPYYIVGAQVYAAPIILKYGLEVIPTAYIIVGFGGAAALMSKARVIPFERYDVISAYVLAAWCMGMRFSYIEAGSGAPTHIPPDVLAKIRKVAPKDLFLIVGGGIRSAEAAKNLAMAGADAIVTGTIIEQNPEVAVKIVRSIKSVKRR